RTVVNRLLGYDAWGNGPLEAAAACSSFVPQPVMPVVFAVAETNLAGLTDRQRALVQRLQQRFAGALSGLDPQSQEYAQQWQKVQQEEDSLLKGMLGSQAYETLRAGVPPLPAQNAAK